MNKIWRPRKSTHSLKFILTSGLERQSWDRKANQKNKNGFLDWEETEFLRKWKWGTCWTSEIEGSKLWPTIFVGQLLNKWFLRLKNTNKILFLHISWKHEIQISMSVKILGDTAVLICLHITRTAFIPQELRGNKIWHIRLQILISGLPKENFLTSDLKTKEDMNEQASIWEGN